MQRGTDVTVGVLGGMGPEATLAFFEKVLEKTHAKDDQDHLHLIIDNNPKVPNRNLAIAGSGPSPAQDLAAMAGRLERAGADFLVMPCNAAHAFKDAIEDAVSIPLVDIVDETRDEVMLRFPEAKCVGVLASTGCTDAGLYQRAFGRHAIDVIVPRDASRRSFMQLVYTIKAGDKSPGVKLAMLDVAMSLIEAGAELIVAGCTEVPLVLSSGDLPCPLIDSLDVLAARTVERALTSF